ncbi:hypothetical protein, partial [Mycobacterium gordonae]|uniref:hypothetical protein n=1 Tax=Mycobacterium gordonae TaxID=1778 RepID=UPI001C4A44E9
MARAMAQLRAAAAHPNARNRADVVIAGCRFAVVFAALAVRQGVALVTERNWLFSWSFGRGLRMTFA